MPTPNYATSIAPKPYVAAADNSPVESWFAPSTRALPAGVTLPTWPGTLNSYERAEVEQYLRNPTDAVLATLRLPEAIEKALEYKALHANPAYQAWLASVRLDKLAQWKLAVGSAVISNVDAVPDSLDDSGTGTPPPDPVLPPGASEP